MKETNGQITLPQPGDTGSHITPKSPETKMKWLHIFEDYKSSNLTMEDVAIMHKVSKPHVSQVVAWVNSQLGQNKEMGVYRRITVKRMEKNLSRMDGLMGLMEKLLDTGLNEDTIKDGNVNLYKGQIKDLVSVSGEVRKNLEAIGKLMHVMDEHKKDAPMININMPNIDRGHGVQQTPTPPILGEVNGN